MILQSLARLAEREGLVADPASRIERVHRRIEVSARGTFVTIHDLRASTGKGRPRPVARPVPRLLPGTRKSGTEIDPCFAVENATFVVGRDFTKAGKQGAKKGEMERRREAFRALVDEAAAATGHASVKAVARFLADEESVRKAGDLLAALSDFEPNELLLLACASDGGLAIHELPDVCAWWAQRLAAAEEAETATGQCLITGATGPVVGKHPMLKLPGGNSTGVSLVSFNDAAYESHGWHRNENAPASSRGTEAYSEALKRLLMDGYPDPRGSAGTTMPRQNYRLSGDTTAVFWADNDSPLPGIFALGFDADPKAVLALLESVWDGRRIDLDDVTPFYLLVLSAAQARASVRSFHVSTLKSTTLAVKRYIDDIQVDDDGPRPCLQVLLRSLTAGGDDKKLSPTLAGELFEAVLADRPFPRRVLHAAVQRCHAEQGDKRGPVPRDRASLLKACLNRLHRHRKARRIMNSLPHIGVNMDHQNRNTGYLLGRLFACLERMQQLALGANRNVTIVHRYFSSAGTTPRAVFPRLLKSESHHYAKAREGDFPGQAIAVRRIISEICDQLLADTAGGDSPGPSLGWSGGRFPSLPAFLPLEEQALFALAYHQQRHRFYSKQPPSQLAGQPAAGIQGDARNEQA